MLGETLRARSDQVLAETVKHTAGSGESVDAMVQDSFERICRSSTVAVARWIAGEGLEVTNDAARETSQIFGELAAHRAASLDEVTRRTLWWRNVMASVLREVRERSWRSRAEALAQALSMVQLSLEFSLLRDVRVLRDGAQARPTKSSRGARRSSRSWRPTTR